jgi:putative DNA primase/helicase
MARCPAHEDRTPSLSIKAGLDGRVLFTCHAGCERPAILASLQLSWSELRTPEHEARGKIGAPEDQSYTTQQIRAWPWTQALYEYQDAAGEPAFLVVRLQPPGKKKTFLQYRPSGPGEWRKGLEGRPVVLYRLPEVLQANAAGLPIYLVEGEKDVETLRALGLTATCNPGGAGKWREHFQEALRGARVVLCPDNDEVGQAHAQQVAQALYPVAAEVRLLELAGLAPKGDVTDWLAAGRSRAELEQLAATTTPWQPLRLVVSPPPASEQLHLTDLGNARRFVQRHGSDVRFCHPWQRWLVWNGRRWVPDQTGEVLRKAKETVLSIYAEASEITDDRQRQATVDHARRSEAQVRLKALVASAESEPGLPILPDQLDAQPWLLNCQNGTLDLRTGELHPHRREDLLTKLIAVAYEPGALCPTWDAFLASALGSNQRMNTFLQRAAGYSLTSETREHCLFFLYGSGRNGKSTFLECFYGLLGDYAQKADFTTFLEKKHDSIRNDLARLKGCRFLSASEASEGRRLAEALVKDLTGGETITARHLYGEYFDFKPQFKLFLSANHRPSIRGTDEGIWSRIRLIPFTVFIPAQERDPRLPQKLRAEWPGILAWAVRGCLQWQKEGLAEPEEITCATQQYRDDMDPLAGFLSQHCRLSEEAAAPAKDLFESYSAWCRQYEKEPITQTSFGLRLTGRDLRRVRGRWHGQVVWLWRGIELDGTRPVGSEGPARAR